MRVARRLALTAFSLAALNVAVLAVVGSYDLRFGSFHLPAAGVFKPLLYLNAAFLLVGLLALSEKRNENESHGALHGRGRAFAVASALLIGALYIPSFSINLEFADWTHRFITTTQSVGDFFTHKQYDGFYRPLVFTSLALDNALFGPALWAYHFQNLFLHRANVFLVFRLGRRLGLDFNACGWAAVFFAATPLAFEAVIWPGARFDLMATFFVLAALERALAGATILPVVLFCCGVLSKESAYSFPLLIGLLYLRLREENLRRVLIASVIATSFLVAIRIAVYGDLGGYPAGVNGASINVQFNLRTITSFVTRYPAALFVMNEKAGLPLEHRASLLLFAGTLMAAAWRGFHFGSQRYLVGLSAVSLIPAINIVGWLNESAMQSRYLYLSAVFVLLAFAPALLRLKSGLLLSGALVAALALSSLGNVRAYLRMLQWVPATVGAAVKECEESACCTSFSTANMPEHYLGALYFRHQVNQEVCRRLCGKVKVIESKEVLPSSRCLVIFDWNRFPHP